jgi:iron complex outermembrane recepter protein
VKGLEFDGSFNPIDALELRAAVVYLDAKYDSYPASQYGDLSGKSVGGVPEWSTTLGATYTAPLNDDISLILNADYSYQSNVKISDDPAYSQYQREVNNLGASATLVAENGVQFSLWARNLTNEKYFYGIFPSVIQDGSVSGYPTQPRTFGASVKYKF